MNKIFSTKNQGFTLIELMITVAIIGVLTAVAYPAYTDSILKGRRAQARTSLLELMQQQERYMTQNNCYMAFTTNVSFIASAQASCGATPSNVPFKVFAGENASHASYRLSAESCSDNAPLNECVKLVASPVQSDPKAGDLTITSSGLKGCTGSAKSSNFALCWP